MDLRSFHRRMRFIRRALTVTVLLFFALTVTTAFVKIEERYECEGQVRPVDEVSVYSPAAGLLKDMAVRENDAVASGTILCQLSALDLEEKRSNLLAQQGELLSELNLQQKHIARIADTVLPQWLWFSETDLRRSRNVVENRQKVLEMYDKLIKEGLVSKLEYDQARLELTQAEAETDRNEEKVAVLAKGFVQKAIAEAQAQADVLKTKLDSLQMQLQLNGADIGRRTIRADVPGTVTKVLLRHPGEPVAEGQELLCLRGSEECYLYLFGGGRNIHRVKPGQEVRFETDSFSAFQEGYCYGVVDLVSPDSNLALGITATPHVPESTFFIRVRVTDTPHPLKLGSRVVADIALRRESIIKVLFNID